MKPRNEICIRTDENRLKMSALTIQTILTTHISHLLQNITILQQ